MIYLMISCLVLFFMFFHLMSNDDGRKITAFTGTLSFISLCISAASFITLCLLKRNPIFWHHLMYIIPTIVLYVIWVIESYRFDCDDEPKEKKSKQKKINENYEERISKLEKDLNSLKIHLEYEELKKEENEKITK